MLDDLTGSLRGDVRCDPVTTAIYSSDASLYQIRPLGVAYPKDADDVRTLARYAAEQELALVPRGAGSSVAGGAVGAGLIVDFARYMNRVLSDDGETVRVEPGVALEPLNRRLLPSGRYFPPDPAAYAITTIGGMIATNAAGSHSIQIGTTRDHIKSLESILIGGSSFEATREDAEAFEQRLVTAGSVAGNAPNPATLLHSLRVLLTENKELVEAGRPRSLRNNCGYHVWNALRPRGIDLAGLLVGSEGTLGLFSAATIRVAAIPAHREVALLLFGSIEEGLDAVQAVLPVGVAACDLIDRRLLSLAREGDVRFEQLISPSAEVALLVEVIGETSQEAQARLDEVLAVTKPHDMSVAARASSDDDLEGVRFLWTLPGKVVPRLTKLRGLTRPLPIVEDIAVPPEAMQEFRVRAQKVFQRHQVTATLYAHAGAGQMHFRPFLPPPEAGGGGAALESLARDLYQVVLSLGGVVSGEHGDGLARTAFVRTQYGPLYRVFQQIKEMFDPAGLLNPGKIISDDPKATIRYLRPTMADPPAITELNLRWSPQRFAEEAVRCNGCGNCRTQEVGLRMCPFFRVDETEDATPRAKATAARLLASGALSPNEAESDIDRLTSLCFNCKQCHGECPSEVDIPHLVMEMKGARVAADGLSRSDWALSRTHMAGPFGNSLAFATNQILASSAARWLLEKSVGLSRRRKLPRYARRPFLRTIPRRCRTLQTGANGEKAVIYFVDEFANRFDPELARAFIAVCERQGFAVHVPAEQLPSGMALASAGDLAAARELAEENVRILAPFAREGHRIVCTEPSAAVCLKTEYPFLLDHPEVELVAQKTMEAGAFLAGLHREGKFDTRLNPLPLSVGYHTPCHVRSQSPDEPLATLLTLIPELRLHKIETGCSGMAGTWGLSTKNFRTSIRMGWPLITAMRDESITCGATECSSCKMQMEQGTTKATLHPLKLLAWSYAGKMPVLPKGSSRLLTT